RSRSSGTRGASRYPRASDLELEPISARAVAPPGGEGPNEEQTPARLPPRSRADPPGRGCPAAAAPVDHVDPERAVLDLRRNPDRVVRADPRVTHAVRDELAHQEPCVVQ